MTCLKSTIPSSGTSKAFLALTNGSLNLSSSFVKYFRPFKPLRVPLPAKSSKIFSSLSSLATTIFPHFLKEISFSWNESLKNVAENLPNII